jgi:hypothetical protein
MKEKIKAKALNKTAQLHYRATGNPPNTLPAAAISNCFPGLEYDFKNFWRRAFVGIVLLEWDNYVIEIEKEYEEQYKHLKHHRLLMVDEHKVVTTVRGPVIPGGDPGDVNDLPSTNVDPVTGPDSNALTMEWSNALAYAFLKQGQQVTGYFTPEESDPPVPVPKNQGQMLQVTLTVRRMLEGDSVAPAAGTLEAGELTQTLCSPWQHDYRECACYYWPASRPDYVNVEPTAAGISRGDNWMSKERTGEYILDDRKDTRLVTYDELFREWQKMLRFEIKGRDAEES